MPNQKISDLSGITSVPSSYLFEIANPGVNNFKITKNNLQLDFQQNDLIDQSVSFTYNVDQTINTISKGSIVKTFSYNADGTINTISNGSKTKTFSYNADGTISGSVIA